MEKKMRSMEYLNDIGIITDDEFASIMKYFEERAELIEYIPEINTLSGEKKSDSEDFLLPENILWDFIHVFTIFSVRDVKYIKTIAYIYNRAELTCIWDDNITKLENFTYDRINPDKYKPNLEVYGDFEKMTSLINYYAHKENPCEDAWKQLDGSIQLKELENGFYYG